MTAVLVVPETVKTDVEAMIGAARIKHELVSLVDRKMTERKRRIVSLLRTHTRKEQNRTLLTFEQEQWKTAALST